MPNPSIERTTLVSISFLVGHLGAASHVNRQASDTTPISTCAHSEVTYALHPR